MVDFLEGQQKQAKCSQWNITKQTIQISMKTIRALTKRTGLIPWYFFNKIHLDYPFNRKLSTLRRYFCRLARKEQWQAFLYILPFHLGKCTRKNRKRYVYYVQYSTVQVLFSNDLNRKPSTVCFKVFFFFVATFKNLLQIYI
jgi:hypothetical protein